MNQTPHISTRVALVAADFNKQIVEPMIDEAKRTITENQASLSELTRVPGCYELPLVCELLMQRTDVDVVIVLGFIERGETLHGEIMGHVVQQSLVDMQIRHRKPVGIGIIGPGATPEQAETRKIGYARAAVEAALNICATISNLS
jgi:6,7-dimethyl-8-ribityllumazine synthase